MLNEKDMKSYLLQNENTLASNEFESMDRVTKQTSRCHYTRLRGLWRMYYLVISIKNKIHDYLFMDVYGIDREEQPFYTVGDLKDVKHDPPIMLRDLK